MPISKITPVETITHLALLIDSSGSMQGLTKPVVDNVNAVLKGLADKAKEMNQKVVVSLYSFGGSVDQLILNTPVSSVGKLTYGDYQPDGGTPMFGGLTEAIDGLKAIDKPNVANLVTLVTDGEATDGGTKTAAKVADAIKALTATDRWSFTFVVPEGRTGTVQSFFPQVPKGNIQEWETTEKGLNVGSQQLSSGYANYLGLRSKGLTNSNTGGMFVANVTANQAKNAKSKLTDVRGDFKEMTVRTQDPKVLQAFIESRNLTFVKGKSFYQLSKPETVQSNKEVLLREIKTGAVYGGRDARDILGLPVGLDTKVKPADHGDWDVFVQSTSNNRKLMVGTNLLYLK